MTGRGATNGGAGGMWGGRFTGDAEAVFRAMNDSLPIDWRLVQQDIRGSLAWAGALGKADVLTGGDVSRLTAALRELAAEAAVIDRPPVESGAEDVHTWVEQRLVAELGDLGKKLHTGRSRNDQVATDLRLWMRDAVADLLSLTARAIGALLDQADAHAGTPFPAYTHLQSAQPVTFGHWCLAYVEMLERDASRLADVLRRADFCPLGSAALAGTAYPIDREALASELGFSGPTRNSLDAVADRDPVLELLGDLSIMGVHLSRLAEDLIVYNSVEFGLVRLDDGVTSGSSLMPQKKNPDSLELIRGISGPLIGAQVAMLTTVKGLPLAYNKDLQFDKGVLFDAVDSASAALKLTARTCQGLVVDAERAARAASAGYANATDVADLLVDAGVPFREAHDRVGRLVNVAIERGLAIEALPDDELAALLPEISIPSVRALRVERVLAAREVIGGASPERVREASKAARTRLQSIHS
ncbi:MAG: argininosuccinate lyase [Planctomycetota bacterium]